MSFPCLLVPNFSFLIDFKLFPHLSNRVPSLTLISNPSFLITKILHPLLLTDLIPYIYLFYFYLLNEIIKYLLSPEHLPPYPPPLTILYFTILLLLMINCFNFTLPVIIHICLHLSFFLYPR